MATDALVVAGFEQIASLKWTEHGFLLHLGFLLREGDIRAVSREAGVEGATLANSVVPWLFTVDDLRVFPRICVTSHFLLTLIWFERVADPVELHEWFSFDACGETWSSFWDRAGLWAVMHVREFGLAHELVATRHEWLPLGSGARRRAQVVLACILIRITESVTCKSAECLPRTLASVNRHAFVKANFVAFLTECLVDCACVSIGQPDWHRE